MLLSHSFEEIKGSSLVIDLLKLAKNYLDLPYTDCVGELRSYYDKLKNLKNMEPTQDFRNNPGNYLDKKYILKPGIRPYINSVHYDNESITDKIAEGHIKKFPATANNFLNERERAVYEAKANLSHSVNESEDAVKDEAVEKKIALLIEADDLKAAKKAADELLVKETKEAVLKTIKAAEEKIEKEAEVEKAAKAKKAADDKKKAAAKKLADEKAAK